VADMQRVRETFIWLGAFLGFFPGHVLRSSLSGTMGGHHGQID